jgi:hypothetical protein
MNRNPVTGQAGKSDPYIRVTLGKYLYDDRKNAVEDVNDVDLYKSIITQGELPGASQLKVEIMDKNSFSSDALIGSTTIDLEDRLFDNRWQNLSTITEEPKRWKVLPIEQRPLYTLSSAQPQVYSTFVIHSSLLDFKYVFQTGLSQMLVGHTSIE